VGRVWLRMKGNRFIPDIVPLDARYFVHEDDEDGMVWGSSFIERDKAQIEAAYPKAQMGGVKKAIVTEYCSREERRVYIRSQKVIEQPHGFKDRDKQSYCPYVVELSRITTTFMDEDAFEHQGEGLLWPVRLIYPELNRIATIDQSITFKAFTQSYQREVGQVNSGQEPDSPFEPGKTIEVEKGGKYDLIPLADIQDATKHGWSVLDQHKQQGSVSTIDYGNLTIPLPASGIKLLMGPKQLRLNQLLAAMKPFFEQTFEMATWQLDQLGKTIDIGRLGSRVSYSPSDLKQDYFLAVKFYPQDPVDNIANVSVADAMGTLVSEDYKRRHVLELQDPDGERDKVSAERLKQLVPLAGLIDDTLAMARQTTGADDPQNLIVAAALMEIEGMISARGMPPEQQAGGPAKPEPNAQQAAMAPLLGGGGGGRKPPDPTKEKSVEKGLT
ncbi:hypothetical protein LCGC14_2443550, partial [marine sediment metagenome]